MLEHRQDDPLLKKRHYAYQVTHAYIMSASTKKGDLLPQLNYKPFATARFTFTTPKDHKLAINLSRRVHSYFTSTFARTPLLTKLPNDPDDESQKSADRAS